MRATAWETQIQEALEFYFVELQHEGGLEKAKTAKYIEYSEAISAYDDCQYSVCVGFLCVDVGIRE